jgi:hypothetical protein
LYSFVFAHEILFTLDDVCRANLFFQSKPWKSILTSLPVWAILVASATGNYGAYMLLTQMPTYLEEVLKLDIKSVRRLTRSCKYSLNTEYAHQMANIASINLIIYRYVL